MSDQDDNETQGVVFGVLAAVILGVIALVSGLAVWAANQAANAPAAPPAAMVEVEASDLAPVGEALAKIYFAVGSAALDPADLAMVERTQAALAERGEAIVLLSGFHDESGDPAMNAELAKQRALAVREVLVAGGVAVDRIKLRRPESTVGSGAPEEGRRVEVRVQ